MSGKPSPGRFHLVMGLALLLPTLPAQRLPVRFYTVNDGLPHNAINDILRDSHGFLWFSTPNGLSRFDGYEFTNYRMDDLPSARVNTLLETRAGDYLAGTSAGLYRFNPNVKPTHFTVYQPEDPEAVSIRAVFEDRAGNLWCGTYPGLYRFDPSAAGAAAFHFVDLGVRGKRAVNVFAEDGAGNLWMGTDHGLFRRNPDGHIEHYWDDDWSVKIQRERVNALLLDRNDTLWAATWGGLWRITLSTAPGALSAKRVLGLPGSLVFSVFESGDGHLWAGTYPGLSEIDQKTAKVTQQYSTVKTAEVLTEDLEGNLWVGSGSGAARISGRGFWSYPAKYGGGHGLEGKRDEPTDILESQAGELVVGSNFSVSVLEEGHLTEIRPQFPSEITAGWGWYQTVLQDREGDWWFPTRQGLFRFGPARSAKSLAGLRPKVVYTQRDGLASDEGFRLFEDRVGNIWVASIGGLTSRNGVSCWVRATGKWQHYFRDPPPPMDRGWVVSTFAQDSSGALWVGFYQGGLTRFRDGVFRFFTEADGWVGGSVRAIHEDRYGALWIGSSRGLTRVGFPGVPNPQFQPFRTAQGLSSTDVQSVISDDSGRIYVSTGAGVDQVETLRSANSVSLTHIRHYTAGDGLISQRLHMAFRDRTGAIWFGDNEGLSRFQPEPPKAHPSPVVIQALRIAGVTVPVADLGESALTLPALEPAQNNVQIEYSGLNFAAGETLRYQYMLEGADKVWSGPTTQRAVYYSSLSPGKYRFLVRAVTVDGLTSVQPAAVDFTVLAPIWRRWWLQLPAIMVAAAIAYALYRYRLARLLALERLRTRIATDLHDDIGSTVSQIAMLSEVAGRHAVKDEQIEPLSDIANLSRELVDSMSEIVWAIDPAQDRLDDLAHRMRRFASDLFDTDGVRVEFRAPGQERNPAMDANMRRQIFLIFKEALHNASRHSGCTEVEIDFRFEKGMIDLRIQDNGAGCDLAEPSRGHGLASMQQRAKQMGGRIWLASQPGHGTTIQLHVPLARHLKPRMEKTLSEGIGGIRGRSS
jgi:ligand-binding sensor domain-containing protein/signal transduction histidine kinase